MLFASSEARRCSCTETKRPFAPPGTESVRWDSFFCNAPPFSPGVSSCNWAFGNPGAQQSGIDPLAKQSCRASTILGRRGAVEAAVHLNFARSGDLLRGTGACAIVPCECAERQSLRCHACQAKPAVSFQDGFDASNSEECLISVLKNIMQNIALLD